MTKYNEPCTKTIKYLQYTGKLFTIPNTLRSQSGRYILGFYCMYSPTSLTIVFVPMNWYPELTHSGLLRCGFMLGSSLPFPAGFSSASSLSSSSNSSSTFPWVRQKYLPCCGHFHFVLFTSIVSVFFWLDVHGF